MATAAPHTAAPAAPAAHPAGATGATGATGANGAHAAAVKAPEPVPPGRQLSDGNPSGTSLGQGPDDKISFYGAPAVGQAELKSVNAKQMKDPNFKPSGEALGEIAAQLLKMGLVRPARDPDEVAAEEAAKKAADEAAAKEKAAAGATGATGATGTAAH